MLIAPHQFAGPTFAPLRPWIMFWGAAFFGAGVSLVTISAVGARGAVVVGACVGAGLALLVLAGSFLLTAGWTGIVVYTIFGVATLLSPLADRSSAPGEEGIDLFVLVAAVAGFGNGLVLLLTLGTTLGPFAALAWSPRIWTAVPFLLGGGGVLITRLRGSTSPFWRGLWQMLLGIA